MGRPRRRRLRRVRAARRRTASRCSRGRTRGTRSASTTGRIAEGPIAPCEVQGYVYDAKLRDRRDRARRVARPRARRPARARGGRAAARFDEAFWVEERGGFYALALDGEKRRVDSLTSNIGHLLCHGIVPPERVDAVVDQLMGAPLWSGWGVRTMSSDDAGFNPLSYHNGTVWPHDNSLIAWGLARQGRWQECHQIVRRMLDAAGHFDWQLPEVFAGLDRAETPFPIAYPTAARPQAWAAGTPVLLLQLLLGLVPGPRRHRLETGAPRAAVVGRRRPRLRRPRVRPPLGRASSSAAPCAWRRAMKVAILAPVWFPVPPTRLRRDRVGRLAARGGARRRRPRRDALRRGRVAHEGEARVRLRRGAERGRSAARSRSCATCSTATRARTSST